MIQFFVPGKPQGKGRARAFKMRNGHIGHYTPGKTKTYEGLIQSGAIDAMGVERPTCRPVKLSLLINYEVPISWPKWKIQYALNGQIAPTVKPDSDNVCKAVKDALNGVVWKDDCQVVMMDIQKQYSVDPGLLISVTMLSQCQAQIKSKGEVAA